MADENRPVSGELFGPDEALGPHSRALLDARTAMSWDQRRSAVDLVSERIIVFKSKRDEAHTKQYHQNAKYELLTILRELERSAPASAKKEGSLQPFIEELATNRDQKHSVKPLLATLQNMRHGVLPPRQHFAADNEASLLSIDGAPQMAFLRRISDAATAERKERAGAAMFAKLPSLGRMADYIAPIPDYYQLGEDAFAILKKYDAKTTDWGDASQAGPQALQLLLKEFHHKHPGPHAIDFSMGIHTLEDANSAEQIRRAHEMLHNRALDFVFGNLGHPNFLNRLNASYNSDREGLRDEAKRALGRAGHYRHPLEEKSQFLELVGEARWARAMTLTAKLVDAYQGVLGSPKIVAISARNQGSFADYITGQSSNGRGAHRKG